MEKKAKFSNGDLLKDIVTGYCYGSCLLFYGMYSLWNSKSEVEKGWYCIGLGVVGRNQI